MGTSGCQNWNVIWWQSDRPMWHSRILAFVHLPFYLILVFQPILFHMLETQRMLIPGSIFYYRYITLEFLFSCTQFYFFMQHPVFFFCLVHSATYFNLVYRSGMQHGLPVVDCRHPRIKACITSCQSNGSSTTWWGSGKFYIHSMLRIMNFWMSLCQTFQSLDSKG